MSLLLVSAQAGAQESGIVWTVSSMEGPQQGTYRTQEEAAAAIEGLPSPFPPGYPIPNPYPYIDTIKEPQVGSDGKLSIVYWMGLKPSLDPDWKYNAGGLNGAGPFAAEAELVAAIQARYNQDYAECTSNAKVTFVGDWYTEQPLHEGTIEQRRYSVEYSDGLNTQHSPCEPQVIELGAMRSRHQQCPNMFMQWDNARQACASWITASISPGKIQECGADAVGRAEQGNPCNVKTGAKVEHQTDVDLGWVRLTRTYHSGVTTKAGGFGPGWSHSLDRRLVVLGDTMNLSGGGGYQVRYTQVGNAYLAADNSGDRIVAVGDQWWLYRGSDVLIFDSQGQLVEQRSEDGTGLAYSYTATGRLDAVTHTTGRSIRFVYASPAADAVISGVTADGITLVSYAYSAGQQVETATFADGGRRQYHYEDSRFPRLLTGVTREDNQRYSTFTYDAKGRVTSSQHAGGADGITLTYRAEGGTVVTDSIGQTTTYALTDDVGALPRRLTVVADELGTANGTYHAEANDFRGRPASVINRAGTKTEYTYVEANDPVAGTPARTVTTTEAVGQPEQRTSTTTTDVTSNRVMRSTIEGQETRIARNDRLQPISVAVRDTATGEVRTTTYVYCEAADVTAANSTCPVPGLLKSFNGPRTDVNDITTFQYYSSDDPSCAATPQLCTYRKGDLHKTIDALGKITEILGYDPQGRPLSLVDANGVVTDYEYNARGWLITTKVRGADDAVETDDRITRIEYEPSGLVKKVTLPGGAYIRYVYDAAHRLTEVIDEAGNTVRYTLDLAGNRKQEDTRTVGGELKRTLTREFNVLSQLETLKDGSLNATGFIYDSNGNPYQTTDAMGRRTIHAHDALNRLSRSIQDAGGLAAEINYAYNAQDRITQISDPNGLSTHYVYNGFGDRIQLISPDTGGTAYTYDGAGNVRTETDARGVVRTHSYDALNRLITTAYPDSSLNEAYTYDTPPTQCPFGERFSQGHRATMVDGSGGTAYCYSRFGQLVRKVQITNGVTLVVKYDYDVAGRLVAQTYPDGTVADYVRDARGRIASIGVTRPGRTRELLLTVAGYNPFGPAMGWTYGNGRVLERTHDLNYEVRSLRDTAAGGLNLGFARNALMQVSAIHDAAFAQQARVKFDYDPLNRLTKFRDGPSDVALETYDYDKTGNRTQFANNGGIHTYQYSGQDHRLAVVDGIARGYDATGNTTSIDGATKVFVHGSNGRLTQVTQAGVPVMNYAYNGRGERVRRHLGSSDTLTVYDESGRWLGDYDASGLALQQAVWLDDLPVGLVAGPSAAVNRLHYVQPDHLGTPRAVIDPVRDVAVWTWDIASEAFGNSAPNEDPDLDTSRFVLDMRFPGQRLDVASGLNYNLHRDYDASIGRYIQGDPIGLAGDISLYAYALNSPLLKSDPLGLATYVITTYDRIAGVRVATHSALFIDSSGQVPFLYDPAGSYRESTGMRGGGGIFEGAEDGAVLSEYIKYHSGQGSQVEVTRLDTTVDQENRFKINAENYGDRRGFTCARSVSTVLSGYCGVTMTNFPGLLRSQAEGAQQCPAQGK
ncbi:MULTISPECIES: RHS repeat-associated core domain-containing protein [unclassified Stenotrophomonas]|uniref:RHS repeat-associated core domain-containing protein n=1 Tax=unclassified Stenotrophomonas TaxID=196198 RepID=UPI0011B279B0|nr:MULTISPECIES: RHS repeat-associated core domain-containing protein [unclassified Stenotrophomonas]